MIRPGDEDFLPADLVVPLIRRFRSGHNVGEGAARLRFRQGHRALPFAGEHGGQVGFLLLFRSERGDEEGRFRGQHGVHAPGIVCGGEDEPGNEIDDVGELLPAQFHRGRGRDPAALAEFIHEISHRGMDQDPSVFQARGHPVHFHETCFQFLPSEFHGGILDHVEHFSGMFGKIRIPGKGFRIEDLV